MAETDANFSIHCNITASEYMRSVIIEKIYGLVSNNGINGENNEASINDKKLVEWALVTLKQ